MSTQRQPPVALNARGGEVGGGELSGWVLFAGTMLGITATLNVIYGVGAINNANFYVHDAKYVLSGLNAWGWILLIGGAIQFCATVALFGGRSWGRWVGVATASLNSIGQLLFLPSAPFLAIALFAVDVAIIYGLVACWDLPPADA
ncbi:MAG TPA: hypothetical protein VNT55_03955 [Baekduia sp.]|nr:hypothetical protein [Baekduia sp.]